jgi:hypothetical protein
VLAGACGGGPEAKTPNDTAYWARSPEVCQTDEVREYFCDELLPLESALPAPAPYDNCPSTTESHVGVHQPLPPVAVFDKSYTAHIRKRMPPGHSCCYSWCARIDIGTDRSGETVCRDPRAFRESYCFDEPEHGTSLPAGGGFNSCPAAVVPPAGVAFARPKGALFDASASAEKRGQGFRQCCYAWCSIAPAGTGLAGRP